MSHSNTTNVPGIAWSKSEITETFRLSTRIASLHDCTNNMDPGVCCAKSRARVRPYPACPRPSLPELPYSVASSHAFCLARPLARSRPSVRLLRTPLTLSAITTSTRHSSDQFTQQPNPASPSTIHQYCPLLPHA